MTALTTARPQNSQLQSPLVCLPAEIKHMIYGYCFVTDKAIIDPVIGRGPSKDGVPPMVGIVLLQTCRRVYYEADRRPMFSGNRFRFTTVNHVRSFFNSTREMYGACVQDVEIDVRRVHGSHPGVSREWLQYLCWGDGTWGKILGSFHADAPNLKCVRLNFEAWPTIPIPRVELWNLLQSMLLKLEGLERIVVIGASKGSGMAMRDPWSAVHFVGGDNVGSNDLVERMWSAVRASDHAKVIRWSRGDGKLTLEVVVKDYLIQNVDGDWSEASTRKSHIDKWPLNGTCSYFTYRHPDSNVVEPTTKSINPSAAE